MPKPNSPFAKLLARLRADYPELNFLAGTDFHYQSPDTIFYVKNPSSKTPKTNDHKAALCLLHELGHYLIGQNDYQQDIELLQIESRAWIKAKNLCTHYSITWDADFAEDRLDSYRNWLHARSLCPSCGSTGFIDRHNSYHCPFCSHHWPSGPLPG